jgi:hypothetical protein
MPQQAAECEPLAVESKGAINTSHKQLAEWQQEMRRLPPAALAFSEIVFPRLAAI